jgi:hypothetical protein
MALALALALALTLALYSAHVSGGVCGCGGGGGGRVRRVVRVDAGEVCGGTLYSSLRCVLGVSE